MPPPAPLQDDLNTATLQLRAARTAAAAREEQEAAEATARKEQEAAAEAARWVGVCCVRHGLMEGGLGLDRDHMCCWHQHPSVTALILEPTRSREDDTARLATERAGWQRQAAEAEAAAEALRQQLAEARAAAAAEKARSEELAASLWPLASKLKALEAAQARA